MQKGRTFLRIISSFIVILCLTGIRISYAQESISSVADNAGKDTTYPLVEPDAGSEMVEKAQAMKNKNVEFIRKEGERIVSAAGETLIKAVKHRVYYISAEHPLEFDIPSVDKQGNVTGILYPKGYTFNVVDYSPIEPPPIVVFNACDKKEWSKVKELTKSMIGYMLVSSGCAFKDIHSSVPVYLLLPDLKKKFQLSETVSVISMDRKKRAYRVEVHKP